MIDDGPIAEAFLEHFPKARLFDPFVHSFNPLAGMDYKRARDFAEILYTASPGGQNTLTVRNGRRTLVRMLLAGPSRLDKLLKPDGDDEAEAVGMVEDLLMSPDLRRVLCGGGKPFKFGEGTTVARLDRAVLGDFDAFVLGSLVAGQHQGQIVVPDFGFYGRLSHITFIRQDRLTVGLNTLSELGKPDDKLRQGILTIKDKQGAGCTPDDALELAKYLCPFLPGQTEHTDFVQRTIGIL